MMIFPVNYWGVYNTEFPPFTFTGPWKWSPHTYTRNTHTHTNFLDVFFPLRTYPWSSIQQQHFYHLHSSSSPAIQLSILICISFNLHWCVSVSQDVLMGFDKYILFRLSFLPFFDRKVTQRFIYVYICIYAFIFINLSSGNVAQTYHSLFGVWLAVAIWVHLVSFSLVLFWNSSAYPKITENEAHVCLPLNSWQVGVLL